MRLSALFFGLLFAAAAVADVTGPVTPPGSGAANGSAYQNCISVTLSGSADWGASPPTGFVNGQTNCIIVTITANATLTGLLAPAVNQSILLIVVGAHTLSLTGQAAGTTANNFYTSGSITGSGGLLVYVSGQGWVFT